MPQNMNSPILDEYGNKVDFLWVYGTLKSGCKNHSLLKGWSRVGKIPLRGILYNLGPFPAFVPSSSYYNEKGEAQPDPKSGFVKGELYCYNKELLDKLDRFEGVPQLYQRRSLAIDLYTPKLFRERVWVYCMNDDVKNNYPPIINGEWTEP